MMATVGRTWRRRAGEAVGRGHSRALLRDATSLVGTVAVTSGLGVVFWWLAARSFSAAAVGVAGGAVSAMTLGGLLATVGMGTRLMGELPRRRLESGPLIATALAATGVAGLVVGTALVLVGALVTDRFRDVVASDAGIAVFVAGVAATSVGMVLDQGYLGLMRGPSLLFRNGASSLLSVAVLGVMTIGVMGGAMAIFASNVAGTLASFAAVLLIASGRPEAWRRARPRLQYLREMGRGAPSHHAFNVLLAAPAFVLPIVAVGLLAPPESGAFYIAWLVATGIFLIPSAFTTVLYPAGAAAPANLGANLRFTLAASLVVAVIASAVILPLAGLIMGIFGAHYADSATTPLRLLCLAVFPVIVKQHYVALRRISRTVGRALPVVVVGTLLEIVAAALGATYGGVNGMCLAWLVACSTEAAVMLPFVRAAWRRATTEADMPSSALTNAS
jgi:O-antigen/teichoic acid export membrane protein